MNGVVIRPAARDDIAAIASIYAHAVLNGTSTYELTPPTKSEMLARFDALETGGYPWLVASEDDSVLGYAYAGPFRPRPAYRFMVEDSIYLDPAPQGRGLGRRLLTALIAECEKLGFRQMLAVIGDGTAHSPSVRLHAALGFRPAGRVVGSGYKHGRWLDTAFMQLALNGGADGAPDPDSAPERRFRASLGDGA
jgi:L-amino acid N-acyltransferase YncA